MAKFFHYLLLLSFILINACAHKTTVRKHPECDKMLQKCNYLTAFPPKAEVNTVEFGGKKTRMYDYEYSIEDIIIAELPSALEDKGYKVMPINRKSAKNKKVLEQYEYIRESLDEEVASLYRPAVMIEEEKAFNIDKRVEKKLASKLGKATNSCLLLFVDYGNNVQTNGARAMGFVLDVLTRSSNASSVDNAHMLLTFVEARTGRILWTNTTGHARDLFADMFKSSNAQELDTKRVRQLLRQALEDFPDKNKLAQSK